MRTNRRPDDIVGIHRVTAPVTDGLVGSVFQGHISRSNRHHRSPQHFHLLHVHLLSGHIRFAHVHGTGHLHQRADSGCGHTMLSGSRLGNDACFAHLTGNQYLPDGVVDLMGTRVVEVLPLQINLRAETCRQLTGEIERRGSPHIVAQQRIEIGLKALTLHDGAVCLFEVSHALVQNLRDVGSPEFTVIPSFIY